MKKSFMEVITNIKDGDKWLSDRRDWDIESIEYIDGNVIFKRRNDDDMLVIRPDTKFILQRKEYSFEEAFKAYEKEGREIEFKENGCKYKKINGEDVYMSVNSDFWEYFDFFDIYEIRGAWYINN